MQPKLIIFHGGCSDGFCAAWICWRVWPDAEFLPMNYGDVPPDVTDREVMILDFSFKRPVMEQMAMLAKSLVCLDHHKSAEAELAGLPCCIFDINKSGARLTYEWLAGQGLLNVVGENDWLIRFVEDRDLWLWKQPMSREINAALRSYPMDFFVWDKLNRFGASLGGAHELLVEGRAILRSEKQTIDRHVGFAVDTNIGGHVVPCVNATVHASEIAGELAKWKPFAAVWFQSGDGKRIFSLRSAPDGIDVSEVAKLYGGGGHKHAAGFKIHADPWDVPV